MDVGGVMLVWAHFGLGRHRAGYERDSVCGVGARLCSLADVMLVRFGCGGSGDGGGVTARL